MTQPSEKPKFFSGSVIKAKDGETQESVSNFLREGEHVVTRGPSKPGPGNGGGTPPSPVEVTGTFSLTPETGNANGYTDRVVNVTFATDVGDTDVKIVVYGEDVNQSSFQNEFFVNTALYHSTPFSMSAVVPVTHAGIITVFLSGPQDQNSVYDTFSFSSPSDTSTPIVLTTTIG